MESRQSITLGGGCFWCIAAVYKRVDGIFSAIAGYAGGSTPDPTYEAVCSGQTGHAEVAQVTFDPEAISLSEVLRLFLRAHDPTSLNRQGGDVGTQYRSAIYLSDDSQGEVVRAELDAYQKELAKPIVTEIAPLETFYPAEEYHQDYFEKNPHAGYCQLVIAPKLNKLGMDLSPRK